MKLTKIFIMFTFLLAFALTVSGLAQTPKIVWKNFQEKYESFHDVKPIIINENNMPVYFIEPLSERIQLLRFDEQTKTWIKSYKFLCGVGTKLHYLKIKSGGQILLENKIDWLILTKGDGVFDAFPSRLGTNQNERYKLQFNYLDKKKNYLESISPEFSVNESIENIKIK